MPYDLRQRDRAPSAYLRASRACRLPGKYNPDVPAPTYTDVLVFRPPPPTQQAREIDVIASRIGSRNQTYSSYRHYQTSRRFGPVQYRAHAIPRKRQGAVTKNDRLFVILAASPVLLLGAVAFLVIVAGDRHNLTRVLPAAASTPSRAAWWDSASAARERTTANARNPSRNYRHHCPCGARRNKSSRLCRKCSAPAPSSRAGHGAPARHLSATAPERNDAAMTVSIPLVVIFGILVFVAYRYMGLRAARDRRPHLRIPARRDNRRTGNPQPLVQPRQLA